MIAIFYDRNLNFLSRYPQEECPTLSSMGIGDVVLAFDQSTACTGITVGNSKGFIYGYIRLIKEDAKENGGIYISNFQTWLMKFIDLDLTYLVYEHTFSKQYIKTDVILSQLRGTFKTAYTTMNWKFPMTSVMQQEWKSCIISKKGGDHNLTKENVQHVIFAYLLPNIKRKEEYADVYDSIGIYYYYTQHLKKADTTKPVEVTKKLKIDEKAGFSYSIYLGATPMLDSFTRICNSRGVRQFIYNTDMAPREQISRLISNSSEVWYSEIPFDGNKFIDEVLLQCGRLPSPEENIYMLGYRTKKKDFAKQIQ